MSEENSEYQKHVDEALAMQESSTGPFPVSITVIPDAQLPKAAAALMSLFFLCEEAGLEYQEIMGVLSRALQRWAFYVLTETDDVLTKNERVNKVVALKDANFISLREETEHE